MANIRCMCEEIDMLPAAFDRVEKAKAFLCWAHAKNLVEHERNWGGLLGEWESISHESGTESRGRSIVVGSASRSSRKWLENGLLFAKRKTF